MIKKPYELMLVTCCENQNIDEYINFIYTCVRCGITSVQIREKRATEDFIINFYQKLKDKLESFKTPILINDNMKLAHKLKADGVHLGQTDGDPLKARKLLGEKAIIGLSIDHEYQIAHANKLPLDYVAANVVFTSTNKDNYNNIWGLDGLYNLSKSSKFPVIGIGGIDEKNAVDVFNHGASGIAVIGALHNSKDIPLTITNLLKGVNHV